MKKTTKLLWLACLCMLACLFVFSACEEATEDPDHVHSYGSWTVTKEATCKEAGSQERVCECGDKQTKTIPMKEHSFSEWKVVEAATCTKSGSEERICECGSKRIRTIPKKDHSFGEWELIKEATCTAAGSRERTCLICSAKEKKSISSTGHNFGEWKTVSAVSCTEAGTKERVCSICQEKESITTDATGHNFGDWKTVKKAACTTTGLQERKCSNCGDIETKSLPAKGHNYRDGVCSVCYDCNIVVKLPKTPVTLLYDGWGHSVTFKVTEIRYEMYGGDSEGVSISIYWSGQKTNDTEGKNYSSYCRLGYKVYDSEGYIVKSGTDDSVDVKVGEKFRDAWFGIYGLDPNGTYTIEILNVG